MRNLLGVIALATIFGATGLFLLMSIGPQSANAAMCPDGSYVSGSTCTLCPNGSYVGGGRCVLQPDGTYTGGYGGGFGGAPRPRLGFNRYPALEAKTFDYGKARRDAEALRTQRIQNQLLQQQLQQLQQQQRQNSCPAGVWPC